MFDVAAITNVLHLFDGFITSPFVIDALHTVSNSTVAFGASCSSVCGVVFVDAGRSGPTNLRRDAYVMIIS